jgi:phosphatidylinositol alpha-mannosyltransferase
MERYGVGNVDFVGRVPFDELPRYYASCDVFCAPSVARESFGIVLLEAMAAGKPVVAGDNPGYASVLNHGREGLLARRRTSRRSPWHWFASLATPGCGDSLDRPGGPWPAVTTGRFWPAGADLYDRAARSAAEAPQGRGLA